MVNYLKHADELQCLNHRSWCRLLFIKHIGSIIHCCQVVQKPGSNYPDRYQNASRFDFSTSLRQGIFMKFEAIYKMLPLAAVVQKAWDQGSRCQDCQVSVGILEIPSNFAMAAMAMDQFDCLL